ncbi:MAG TPA: type II secretion system protein [Acidimicrobiales bacterium]|nr:type II secretion system protein [Acidimicrobiales bacterium]
MLTRAGRRDARAAARESERGFTLVELAVAMSLMLLVSGAILGALESGTSAERRASTRVDDQQAVRLVLAQLTRDVRNASSVGAPPANTDELDLGYTNLDTVVWTFDPSTHVLQRQSTPNGQATPNTGISLGGITNPTTVFAFLSADGNDLLTDPSASAADLSTCTSTVAVTVTVVGHAKPFTQTAYAPVQAALDRRGCP